VPVIVRPSVEMARPSGNGPERRRTRYPGVPPLKYFWEYGTPTVPDGRFGPSDDIGGSIWKVPAFEVPANVESLGARPGRARGLLVAGVWVTVTWMVSGAVTKVSKRLLGMLTVIRL